MTRTSIILAFLLLQMAGFPAAGETSVQSTVQKSGSIHFVEKKTVKILTQEKIAVYFLDGMEGGFFRGSFLFKPYYGLRIETARKDRASLLLLSENDNVYRFDVKQTIRIRPDQVKVKKTERLQPVVVMPRDTIFLSDRKHTILELPYKINNGEYLDSADTRLIINELVTSKSSKKSFLAFGSSTLYGAEKEQILFIEDNKGNKHFYNVKYVNDISKAMSYYKVAEEMITAAQPQKTQDVTQDAPKKDLPSFLYDDIWRIGLIIGLLAGLLFASVIMLLRRIRKLESLSLELTKKIDEESEKRTRQMYRVCNDIDALSKKLNQLKKTMDKRHKELVAEDHRLNERIRLSSVARDLVRRYNAPYGRPRRTIAKPRTRKK